MTAAPAGLGPGRSWLFVAADRPDEIAAARASAADIVIADLEDLVLPERKAAARSCIAQACAPSSEAPLFVRINGLATEHALADLEDAVRAGVAGIVVPKLSSAADAAIVDWTIGALERRRGLPAGRLEILGIIETAEAFERLAEIGAQRVGRTLRYGLGIGDLATELDLAVGETEDEIAYFRSRLVNASRAAGRPPPVDAVWLDVTDADGLARSAQRGRAFGCGGKFVLTVDQAAAANAALTPSDAEVAEARRVVDQFDAAKRDGLGAVPVDGRFVDEPVAERYRRVLRTAGQA